MSASAFRDALVSKLNEQKMARLQSIIDQARATGTEADQRRMGFSFEAACIEWVVNTVIPEQYQKVLGDKPVEQSKEGVDDGNAETKAVY